MSSINVPQRRLIEGSISKSDEGAAKLKQMTAVMSITESAAKVKNLVDEVSAGNQEQAQGVEQISKTMLELERAIERSVETAEESAAAGEELAAQTESMNAVARELRVLVTG